MDANELDPGLHGAVGEGVGQQMPEPLSADELLARRLEAATMQGRAGLQGR